MPNKYDWTIPVDELAYNRTSRAFYYGENKSKVNLVKLLAKIKKIGESKIIEQIHIYINLHFVSDFESCFNYLFKPSKYLEECLSISYTQTGIIDGNYIAAVFRFQNLLGDFPEANFKDLDEYSQNQLIIRCRKALIDLHDKNIGVSILVTSDSIKFLHHLKDFSFVKYVEGKIGHPDAKSLTSSNNDDLYLKSFVDLFMLSRAKTVYSIYSKEMYKESQFAKTAALIGNKTHHDIFI